MQYNVLCMYAVLQYWFLETIAVEKMDLGSHPMSLGGMKAYHSRDDEAIIECPLMWGSNADVSLLPPASDGFGCARGRKVHCVSCIHHMHG